jgi:hypothetical protein
MLEIFYIPANDNSGSYHFQFTYYKLLIHDQGHTILLFVMLILCFQLIILLATIFLIS